MPTPVAPVAEERRHRWWPVRWSRRAYLQANRVVPPPVRRERSLHWLADYVYGTVSTLVAVAGLSFDDHADPATAVAIVLVSAVAIWWAHVLSRLVNRRAQEHLQLTAGDIGRELRGAVSIVVAALPAMAAVGVVATGVWSMHTGLAVANFLGVLSLAAVGIGTSGGRERPVGRRILYVVSLVGVGVVIVLLEASVHHV